MYGRYLSADDIRELTEPDPAHIAALGGWLDGAGVSWTRQGPSVGGSPSGLRVCSYEPEFRRVVHVETQQTAMRAGPFFLPKEVDESAAAVYGVHALRLPHLPQPSSRRPAVSPVSHHRAR